MSKDYGFFYSNPLGRLLQPLVVLWAWASKSLGWVYDTKLSKLLIKPFIKYYSIKMEDFSEENFSSFNEFFSRKVKPEARPIDIDPDGLMAPADSRLTVCDYITKTFPFPIKGVPFNLVSFLQDEELAKEFEYGTMFVFRLSVDDYHRFHFPTDGNAKSYKEVPGKYHTVRPGIYANGVMPLAQNYRHIIEFASDVFGESLLIPIGALGVSRIVETYTPGKVKKGDEMGYFQFGGSVVVMLIKSQPIKIHPFTVDQYVKMGSPVATKI